MSDKITKIIILYSLLLIAVLGSIWYMDNNLKQAEDTILNQSEMIAEYQKEVEMQSIEISALKNEISILNAEKEVLGAKVVGLEDLVVELEDRETWYSVRGIVTAYSPYDNQSGIEADENPNVTSIGLKPQPGIFAVDPVRIPYGSTIIIEYADGTIEKGIAGDTGATMRNSKHYWVDVYRDTYKETLQVGKQIVNIKWKPAE